MAMRSKVTLRDVAAAAKVSVPAASMALANHAEISPQTRRKIWAASRRLGYRSVGRQVNAPRADIRRLGCVCLGDSFDRPVNAQCFAQITALTSRLDVRLDASCIEDLANHEKLAAKLLQFAQPLDGLVMIGTVGAAAMSAIAKAHIPCVAMGDQPAELQHLPLDVVTYDHVAAGRLATGHLIRRGQRRVAFVTDTLDPGGSNLRWLDGYRLAQIDAGIPLDDRLVAVTHVRDGGTAPQVQRLLGLEFPPTAWVVVNPYVADEILHRLKSLGRRDEVCATYTDRIPQVEGLSVIHYPDKVLCEAIISRLVHLCHNPGDPPKRTLVPFETYNIDHSPSQSTSPRSNPTRTHD